MTTFKGNTADASAPIIGAGFWKKGITLTGVVTGVFDTSVGKCYNLSLNQEISVPGAVLSPEQSGIVKGTEFSVGALKGFEMAIRASGAGDLQVKDIVKITCTGATDTGKGTPRVDFSIEVNRR